VHKSKTINLTTANGTAIEQKDSVKLLGVQIDSALSWDEHVNKLLKKLNFGLLLLSKLRSFLTQDQLCMVYQAFVQSHINYGILVWGLTSQSNLQKIKIVQNKALRIIASLHPLTNVDQLYNDLNIMHVYAMVHYKIAYTTWLLVQNPSLIPSVKLKFLMSGYRTRGEANLKLKNYHFSNNFGKLHFLHMSYCIWNLLPLSLGCERSKKVFKNLLQEFMIKLFNDKTKHRLMFGLY